MRSVQTRFDVLLILGYLVMFQNFDLVLILNIDNRFYVRTPQSNMIVTFFCKAVVFYFYFVV